MVTCAKKIKRKIGCTGRLNCSLAFALKLIHPALASLLFPDLLLVLQGSSTVVEITERRVAAEGSSVLMHAPDIKNVNFTEWEYIRNATPEVILQYYANDHAPTIYSPYQGRVIFSPKNGSILLQRLRETDSGIYKATVDLMQDKARTTLLEVISKSNVLRGRFSQTVQRTGPQDGNQNSHRIIEYLELEGIHKDHRVHLPAPRRTT